jgi:hypothetical protein
MGEKPKDEQGVMDKLADKISGGKAHPAGEQLEGNFEDIESAQAAERG